MPVGKISADVTLFSIVVHSNIGVLSPHVFCNFSIMTHSKNVVLFPYVFCNFDY